jgi:hypothetical protein
MVETEYWLAKLTNGDVIEVLVTQQDRGEAAPWSFRWRYQGRPVEGTLYRDRRQARRSALKYLSDEKLDLISWGPRVDELPPLPKEDVYDEEITISWQQLLTAMASMGSAMSVDDVIERCFDHLRRLDVLPKIDAMIQTGDVEVVASDSSGRIVRLTERGRSNLEGLGWVRKPTPVPPARKDASAPLWQLVLTTIGSMGDVVTIEDIIVRCFELHPKQFGLQGYPKLCDSNRVLPKLYGLISAGDVEMVDPAVAHIRIVRLTGRGRLHLRCIAEGINMNDVDERELVGAAE